VGIDRQVNMGTQKLSDGALTAEGYIAEKNRENDVTERVNEEGKTRGVRGEHGGDQLGIGVLMPTGSGMVPNLRKRYKGGKNG